MRCRRCQLHALKQQRTFLNDLAYRFTMRFTVIGLLSPQFGALGETEAIQHNYLAKLMNIYRPILLSKAKKVPEILIYKYLSSTNSNFFFWRTKRFNWNQIIIFIFIKLIVFSPNIDMHKK